MTSADPYTLKASDSPANLTLQQKIDGIHKIIKGAKSSMLTTHGADGFLRSRAMTPASYESLHFTYIANNTSGKFDELAHDSHVNISFFDPDTTNWISVAGTARVSSDRSLVKKYWGPCIKAWFDDLGDDIHTGDESDPRVSVIEVIPDEIRYWVVTRGKVGQAVDIAKSAFRGHVPVPGELRTITKEDIAIVEGSYSGQ